MATDDRLQTAHASNRSRIALIVGAGIGGLAAGIALRKAGWDIRIFERAPVARELGFGVGLAAYAVAALQELGVAGAVLPQAATTDTLAAITGGRLTLEARKPDGRLLRRLELERRDLPPVDALPAMVMRPVLHGALLQAVGPDRIATGAEAVGFEPQADRVVLLLADGRRVEGDVLLGADGVASIVRRQLHPAEPPPQPSGYFALRGLTPDVALLRGRQGITYLGRGIEMGVVTASATAIYWFLSLLADDVRRGEDAANVLRRMTAGFDPLFTAIAAAATDIRLDELFARDPLPRWGDGRVTLLGDAAHPVLPHTGQGAAQALLDAVTLGRSLAATANPIDGLRQYEAIRVPASRRIVLLGPRIARFTTTRNPIIDVLRSATLRLMPQSALRRALIPAGSGAAR